MRISRVVTALATAALVATGTGATASASGTCTWKLVDTPASPGAQTQLAGPAVVSGGDVWFPGWIRTPGVVVQQPWTLHWNGHSLAAAAAIPQGPFENRNAEAGSFDSATDGWVLGGSLILPVAYPRYASWWHGGRWTTVPLAVSPDPESNAPNLDAVAALSPSDAWAVGGFYHITTRLGALIEHWDGTQWSIVPNPLSAQPGTSLDHLAVVSATDIWAVGRQHDAGGVPVPLAEHWDGSSWSVVPTPAGHSPSDFTAVSANGANDVWATGADTESGTSNLATGFVEHWDGTRWNVVTGLPDLGNSEINAVYAASPTDVWAAVTVVRPNSDLGVEQFLHWDGTTWTTVDTPGPHAFGVNYEYADIAGTGPDDIWASGYVIPNGAGDPTPLIAHLSCG